MSVITDYGYERPEKTANRKFHLSFVETRPTNVLLNPSMVGADVKAMLGRGLINKKTTQTWFENKNHLIPRLQSLKEELGVSAQIILENLEELELDQKYDFCNLDMEVSYTERLGSWIENILSNQLESNANVIITVCYAYRSNPFMTWLTKKISNGFLWEQLQIVQSIIRPEKVIASMTAVLCSLGQYSAREIQTTTYGDTSTTMITVGLYGLNKTKFKIWPTFKEIVDEYHEELGGIDLITRGERKERLITKIEAKLREMNLNLDLVKISDRYYSVYQDGKPSIWKNDLSLVDIAKSLKIDF